MFTQFTFKRFKSFSESTLPVRPVTLIIGANASGKSNALEGIQFLSKLTTLKLNDIVTGIRGQFPGIRGGSAEIAFMDEDWFELGSRLLEKKICLLSQQLITLPY